MDWRYSGVWRRVWDYRVAQGKGLSGATSDHTLLYSPAMAQRVTLRKRNPYNTTSNRRRVVKTPGGKLVYHHLKKLASAPKCGDCGIALPGVCVPLHTVECSILSRLP